MHISYASPVSERRFSHIPTSNLHSVHVPGTTKVKFYLWAGSAGLLLTGSSGVPPDPSINIETSLRACTADELLPQEFSKGVLRSPEWVDSFDPKPLYGCDCSFYKAR
ncbi:unnamed protein product [Ectocarpus sp. CCAP 1310/34]|nr:unnamed protein product [Ectocarpus sp. CCAP 1310/34]